MKNLNKNNLSELKNILALYCSGYEAACEEGPGVFAHVLTFLSMILILMTLPVSLVWVVKVVQVEPPCSAVYCITLFLLFSYKEYERAVIFRLGRLIKGGARGPGVFFIIPCLDIYQKIDMRTATYDVPPQEVKLSICKVIHCIGLFSPRS